MWLLRGGDQRREPGLARALLRRAIADWVGHDHPVTHRPGRPPMVDGLSASVARSGDLGVCAVGACEALGIDVEAIAPLPDWRDIAPLIDPSRPADAGQLLQTWTRKEALAKAMGIGLPDDVRTLAVPAEPIEPGRWLRVDGWLWVGCPCEDGCVASLVVREPGPDQAGRASITERERSVTGVRSWSIEVRP